ncbi:MAG: selenocysteine-specific translation elongation factor, partial [Candidatus Cloacimonetes bacterium]|nr:selenocysteine-specific translation elongation factor [Candidatus Cloacimonadota bacterium]
MRNHYTIATAGHVDHGKTSLIKALTGKDCDTHPQEKLRGITIHLGFSYLKLSEDVNVGIVDVPGHKDFIDTMISGINGIDLVLFIIAADEGFMPQSYEHLQILKVLGVPRGVIVLTKCDLVDEETLFYATEEVKEKTRGSFLENAPIIKTSIFESEYIEKLKALILCELNHPAPGTEDKFLSLLYNLPAPFRYYPDRFFTVKGVGTVVTGTVLSGTFTKKKPLYTLPLNREIKVRKIEVYGEDIETISAGQRASLNLAG